MQRVAGLATAAVVVVVFARMGMPVSGAVAGFVAYLFVSREADK